MATTPGATNRTSFGEPTIQKPPSSGGCEMNRAMSGLPTTWWATTRRSACGESSRAALAVARREAGPLAEAEPKLTVGAIKSMDSRETGTIGEHLMTFTPPSGRPKHSGLPLLPLSSRLRRGLNVRPRESPLPSAPHNGSGNFLAFDGHVVAGRKTRSQRNYEERKSRPGAHISRFAAGG